MHLVPCQRNSSSRSIFRGYQRLLKCVMPFRDFPSMLFPSIPVRRGCKLRDRSFSRLDRASRLLQCVQGAATLSSKELRGIPRRFAVEYAWSSFDSLPLFSASFSFLPTHSNQNRRAYVSSLRRLRQDFHRTQYAEISWTCQFYFLSVWTSLHQILLIPVQYLPDSV